MYLKICLQKYLNEEQTKFFQLDQCQAKLIFKEDDSRGRLFSALVDMLKLGMAGRRSAGRRFAGRRPHLQTETKMIVAAQLFRV